MGSECNSVKEAAMLIDTTVVHDVSKRIAELFVDLPMLTGFSVQHRATLSRDRNHAPLAGELCIADVSVEAWPGWQAGPAVHDAIAQTLLALLNECPESYEALRGQTFARTFH
jgi:hypothetical protein